MQTMTPDALQRADVLQKQNATEQAVCTLSEGNTKVENASNEAFTNNAHQDPTVTHCTSGS